MTEILSAAWHLVLATFTIACINNTWHTSFAAQPLRDFIARICGPKMGETFEVKRPDGTPETATWRYGERGVAWYAETVGVHWPGAASFGLSMTSWSGLKRWFLKGEQCSYCTSHWVALVVVPLLAATWTEAAMLFFPAVWLANHPKVHGR